MAFTQIDPHAALVLIDLQKGIVSLPTAQSTAEVIKKSRVLADAFRNGKQPVVLVNVAGGAPGRTEQPRRQGDFPPDWTQLVPDLGQQPQDHVVTKRTWGAFTGTDLEARLKSVGVTQVVLAGVATSIGVESTARQAYELGFNVSLVVDAMADLNAEAHANSIDRIFPRLGETGTTEELLALLGKAA